MVDIKTLEFKLAQAKIDVEASMGSYLQGPNGEERDMTEYAMQQYWDAFRRLEFEKELIANH